MWSLLRSLHQRLAVATGITKNVGRLREDTAKLCTNNSTIRVAKLRPTRDSEELTRKEIKTSRMYKGTQQICVSKNIKIFKTQMLIMIEKCPREISNRLLRMCTQGMTDVSWCAFLNSSSNAQPPMSPHEIKNQ